MAVRATVTLDPEGMKNVLKMIEDLDRTYRGRVLTQALKAGTKDFVKTVQNEARRITGSEDYAKRIKAYNGKYSRKTTPYLVIQAANSTFEKSRRVGPITLMRRTNYSKIDHFITMGTNAGVRRAGTSNRQARTGRKKQKSVNSDGSAKMVQRATKGNKFLVEVNGRVVPVKQIRHPGTDPSRVYDRAAKRGGQFHLAEFQEKMIDASDKIRRKYGLK